MKMFIALVIIGLIVFNIVVGGFSVQYVIEFWGSYAQHKTVIVPFLPCAIAGLFLGEISIPVAIVTWIVHYFI